MKNIVEVAASVIPGWEGGAYCLAFVYSNKGNFILKGYLREIEEHLAQLKKVGYKYFVNLSLWAYGSHRDIWKFYIDQNIYIQRPRYNRQTKKWTKWSIYRFKTPDCDKPRGVIKEFKRLPKKWLPEMEEW